MKTSTVRSRSLANWLVVSVFLLSMTGLSSCTSVGLGLSVPIGGIGSIGVGVGSDGRVSGGVSVGRGGVSVGVGGTADLPRPAPAPPETATSAPRT